VEVTNINNNSAHVFNSWSQGIIRTLPLKTISERQFGRAGGYSRFTFHRHAVPEMLAARGFDWSVNLDPDVMTLRPWDLRILLDVKLIAGRPVGRGSRTAKWLQARLEALHGGESKKAVLQEFLLTTLNTTMKALARTPEVRSLIGFLNRGADLVTLAQINGGVLVFNNREAVRVQWLKTCTRQYAALHHILEGDQDLISKRQNTYRLCSRAC
ncbi:MAG: hypothetical protein SGPRY_013800, partial [Prymnesium sp.]